MGPQLRARSAPLSAINQLVESEYFAWMVDMYEPDPPVVPFFAQGIRCRTALEYFSLAINPFEYRARERRVVAERAHVEVYPLGMIEAVMEKIALPLFHGTADRVGRLIRAHISIRRQH